MPTSPFEVDGQRGMPSAGIALSIKPTVLLCRCLTEHSLCARPGSSGAGTQVIGRHVSKREDFVMFIGTCNCYPRTLSMSRRGLLCAGGAGFDHLAQPMQRLIEVTANRVRQPEIVKHDSREAGTT